MDIITRIFLLLGLSFFCLLGLYVSYLYGKNTKSFKWREYFSILLWPILSIGALVYVDGFFVLVLFVISMVIGFCAEYVFGFTYHKVLNRRLWIYQRYSIGGYTSILSILPWGVSGIIFYYVGDILRSIW